MRDHRPGSGPQLRHRGLVGLVAGLLAGSVALTGCGAAEQPRASETLPSVPTTAAAPTTPALPPLGPPDFPVPDEARQQTEAGAEAFLRYYIELINRQQAVPAGGPLRELGPECSDCQVIARRFDEAAKDGLQLNGGTLSIREGLGTSFRGDAAEFSFVIDVTPAQALNKNGQAVPDLQQPAQQGLSSGLGLTWSPAKQSWLVAGLTLG